MKIAIAGNGICGISVAKYISEDAPKEKLTIFTDEEYHYYPRPRLIQLLSEKTDLNQLFPYNDEWFKNKNIEIILGKRVREINVSSKELILEDSSKYNYDKLLIANGSSPFVPPIEGVKSEGVFTLRNIKDVLRIREYSCDKRKAVVIGGGLLGLETARALNALGLKVEIIEVASRLLPKQLDEEGAEILKSRIEKLGIEVLLQTTCSQFLLEGAKKYLVTKESGELEADLFIVSAGIRSNVEPAKASGINTNKGILVDKNLRTNFSDVFAAGDCAEFNGAVYGIIPAAIEQGKAAAANILGKEIEYKGTLFQTILKVVGIDLTSLGVVNPQGEGYEELKSKDAAKGIYKKIVIKDGKVIGAIVIGDKRGILELTRIIEEKIDVTRNKDVLLGSDVDLRETFFRWS